MARAHLYLTESLCHNLANNKQAELLSDFDQGNTSLVVPNKYLKLLPTTSNQAHGVHLHVDSIAELKQQLPKWKSKNLEFAIVSLGSSWLAPQKVAKLAEGLAKLQQATDIELYLAVRRGSITQTLSRSQQLLAEVPSLRLAVDFNEWMMAEELILSPWFRILKMIRAMSSHFALQLQQVSTPERISGWHKVSSIRGWHKFHLRLATFLLALMRRQGKSKNKANGTSVLVVAEAQALHELLRKID